MLEVGMKIRVNEGIAKYDDQPKHWVGKTGTITAVNPRDETVTVHFDEALEPDDVNDGEDPHQAWLYDNELDVIPETGEA